MFVSFIGREELVLKRDGPANSTRLFHFDLSFVRPRSSFVYGFLGDLNLPQYHASSYHEETSTSNQAKHKMSKRESKTKKASRREFEKKQESG